MALPKRVEPAGSSEDHSLLVEDCKIWTDKGFLEGSILIEEGKIRRIARRISTQISKRVESRGLIALPGLVDAHVHLRDMELAYKEDFTTGTSAAAAGGVTTVLDMPNTQPPTDSVERLEEKMETASSRIVVNVGFHAAAVPDGEAVDGMAKAGSFSSKLYLPKPISPLDIDSDEVLSGLMRISNRVGLPITVHAEDRRTIESVKGSKPKTYPDLAKARPYMAEILAVERLLRLGKETRCSVHFCHLTLPESLRSIRGSSSKRVSSEVTPHHMLLSRDILTRVGWKAWMVPPLRAEGVRRRLLADTERGLVNIIASDHAPHTIEEKTGSLAETPPGVPGLETTLPLLLTLVNRGRLSFHRLVELTSTNPARVFGLSSKGRLKRGFDGDLVLVDLNKRAGIKAEGFFSKAKYSPFEGLQTQGVVHTTIVGGRIVYREGQIVGRPGYGTVLRKGIPG